MEVLAAVAVAVVAVVAVVEGGYGYGYGYGNGYHQSGYGTGTSFQYTSSTRHSSIQNSNVDPCIRVLLFNLSQATVHEIINLCRVWIR